jgi:hypothetical protein
MSGSTSEYDLKLSGIGTGYDISDGNYPGWCVEDNYQDNSDTVIIYSSYDPHMPDDIKYYRDPTIPKGELGQLIPWDKLNYLLNHKQGSIRDIGAAIFLLMWGGELTTSRLPQPHRLCIQTQRLMVMDSYQSLDR